MSKEEGKQETTVLIDRTRAERADSRQLAEQNLHHGIANASP